jgi:oligoendopeptidase F
MDRVSEALGAYAYLRCAEDQGDSVAQTMRGKYRHVATIAEEMASFIRPELMEIDPKRMKKMLASKELKEWRLLLEQILRFRPYTLSRKEEQLLAMQGTMSESASVIFRQLNDADLKWRAVKDAKGVNVELSHATYGAFMQSPNRAVRKEAFHAFYEPYDAHRNTIAAALAGSVARDVYYAKARGYGSALESALFPDNVPMKVYDNLIASVRANLKSVHRYYELRRRALKLRDIHHYDTYVPIVAGVQKTTGWDEAVKLCVEALAPLGGEYCGELKRGLTTGRWCDRFPNRGKQSGAFSYGTYDAQPYIMMNYEQSVFDHVFTLAHEAGHSMHSYYSARHQPFQYYNYTIFVAEVASTFNEQLLLHYLLKQVKTKKERAYLLSHAIYEIRGTIVRQTMFAEFEKVIHAMSEAGEPLTVDALRREYRKLLDAYFGEGFAIDKELELECLRIPHFYRAFYVYKYATGLSAAIALSQRVLNGGAKELKQYLTFLSGGCSKDPLDLLRDAGVNMETKEPVNAAMGRFKELVEELDELV